MADSSISQYERSVRALADYYRTVELGLSVSLQSTKTAPRTTRDTGRTKVGAIHAIVFGSDHGLVGRFNDVVADHAMKNLAPLLGLFPVPNSVGAITLLIGQILVQREKRRNHAEMAGLHPFYYRPTSGALIGEYLFVSLFRACAELLASENANRLAAMQRVDQNIDELLAELRGTFHRLRQSSIDERLFDVVSDFEVLS